jgi:hypothetical protein
LFLPLGAKESHKYGLLYVEGRKEGKKEGGREGRKEGRKEDERRKIKQIGR